MKKSAKKPLVEVKVEEITMYEGIGAKGMKPLDLGIKAFKRAQKRMMGPANPKKRGVRGGVISDFKRSAWAKLKKVTVPLVRGNSPRRRGNPYVRTR